ncbi:ThuA domain-containing protein [Paenibacillus piri]|uniref:Trehalose utilization n=1 Tax=Paenibacillus piri TaxID=2547395 RepID=A0A4R5KTH1_9BACL|nr:ThuA domain-containing protein [Paenibacillus piri]TDF98732.1 trehalose utilization [Paenibacillus piri]
MKTIYAIVGDFYHAETVIQSSLSLALQPLTEGGSYRLAYISADDLVGRLDDKPAAVILFKEDRVNPGDETVRHWLTEDISTALTRYVEEGGGFVAWHSGLASYPSDSAFVRMLRGHFEYHPSKHQMVSYTGVLPADRSRETAFDILDEHYFVICDEPNTTVFLHSDSIDGHSIAGWTHSFGQGKVCCVTPAHNKEGLLHEGMLELLRSAVLSCCR